MKFPRYSAEHTIKSTLTSILGYTYPNWGGGAVIWIREAKRSGCPNVLDRHWMSCTGCYSIFVIVVLLLLLLIASMLAVQHRPYPLVFGRKKAQKPSFSPHSDGAHKLHASKNKFDTWNQYRMIYPANWKTLSKCLKCWFGELYSECGRCV